MIIKKIYRFGRNSFNQATYFINVNITKLFGKKQYGIIKGYQHRKSYSYFNDLENTDSWQNEVYIKAKEYYENNNLKSVIDLGCGSAFKLIKYFGDSDTIGIDVSPTYETLLEKYPNRTWLKVGETDMTSLTADIVICSDVIEHVLDPDELLNDIKKIKDVKYIVISTPDRAILTNAKKYGPPLNHTHIREWSFQELGDYVSEHFDIIEHFISNQKQYTQCIVCKFKDNK